MLIISNHVIIHVNEIALGMGDKIKQGLLTTYDSWDDPPSSASVDFCWLYGDAMMGLTVGYF